MSEASWSLRELSTTVEQELELVDVFVSPIEKKDAAEAINELNYHHPLPALRHLRRIRSVDYGEGSQLEILLCLAEEVSEKPPKFPADMAHVVERFQLIPTLAQVQAVLRGLWSDWCAYWPMPWRVTRAVSTTASEERDQIQRRTAEHMPRLMELVRPSSGKNAAFIVEPVQNKSLDGEAASTPRRDGSHLRNLPNTRPRFQRTHREAPTSGRSRNCRRSAVPLQGIRDFLLEGAVFDVRHGTGSFALREGDLLRERLRRRRVHCTRTPSAEKPESSLLCHGSEARGRARGGSVNACYRFRFRVPPAARLPCPLGGLPFPRRRRLALRCFFLPRGMQETRLKANVPFPLEVAQERVSDREGVVVCNLLNAPRPLQQLPPRAVFSAFVVAKDTCPDLLQRLRGLGYGAGGKVSRVEPRWKGWQQGTETQESPRHQSFVRQADGAPRRGLSGDADSGEVVEAARTETERQNRSLAAQWWGARLVEEEKEEPKILTILYDAVEEFEESHSRVMLLSEVCLYDVEENAELPYRREGDLIDTSDCEKEADVVTFEELMEENEEDEALTEAEIQKLPHTVQVQVAERFEQFKTGFIDFLREKTAERGSDALIDADDIADFVSKMKEKDNK